MHYDDNHNNVSEQIMKVTANEFRKKPFDAYLKASSGEVVTINHDRYRDVVFELTARKRNPVKKESDANENNK